MTCILQITEGPTRGHYLKGPRSPAEVRRRGYGFTQDIAEAWPFATPGEASRKRHAVAKHMSWPLSKLEVKRMKTIANSACHFCNEYPATWTRRFKTVVGESRETRYCEMCRTDLRDLIAGNKVSIVWNDAEWTKDP